eukprot:209975-Chlamydomonas_euryale.AAC.2
MALAGSGEKEEERKDGAGLEKRSAHTIRRCVAALDGACGARKGGEEEGGKDGGAARTMKLCVAGYCDLLAAGGRQRILAGGCAWKEV